MTAFVDTNILIDHLVGENPDMRSRSTGLFARVRTGELTIVMSDSVIFEACWVLSKRYRVPRAEIRDALTAIALLPGLSLEHRDVILDALDLWARENPLSFADCYHLLYTRHLGLTQIYTFDRKMNRLPGVTRVEP